MSAETATLETNAAATLEAAMTTLGQAAKAAADEMAEAAPAAKVKALRAAAEALRATDNGLLAANAEDLEAARKKGLASHMADRLLLDSERIEAMARSLEEVAALPDPVGREIARWTRPNGLDIARVSVPLGVIGIVYESRPNVTADAGGLCLKAGNAAILRGGSESFASAGAILDCLRAGLKAAGLPEDALQRVPVADRAAVGLLLAMSDFIDVIVPRGGKGLIERVQRESRIPVLAHLDGNCHTYVHAKADLTMAREIVLNGKMRRVSVCGATEKVLIDRAVAKTYLKPILDDLAAAGCELRGDEETRALYPAARTVEAGDWEREFLAPIIAVKVVDDLEQAIRHVNRHGSHHTDAIVTDDSAAAERFLAAVDSAIVLHNASTQYADGGEFGMGAEIGISTGKLHARGPVGAEQLTSYKNLVRGTGQVRP
ncbi:MAG: glutamate-5-semialdehyde dehydrogenase [Kiloniellales bacterium]